MAFAAYGLVAVTAGVHPFEKVKQLGDPTNH